MVHGRSMKVKLSFREAEKGVVVAEKSSREYHPPMIQPIMTKPG